MRGARGPGWPLALVVAALVLVLLVDVVLFRFVARNPDDAHEPLALPMLVLTLAAALAPLLCIRSVRLFGRVTSVTSGLLFLCSFALYYLGFVTLVAAALHCAAAVRAARRKVSSRLRQDRVSCSG